MFAAGVITDVLQDWPLEEILRFTGAVVASCTRAPGARRGYFRSYEDLAFVSENSLPVERSPSKVSASPFGCPSALDNVAETESMAWMSP